MDPQPLNYQSFDPAAARRRRLRRVGWALLLALAALEFVGGPLWCVGGAGIYGSPLANMPREFVRHAVAFVLVGPMSLLPGLLLAWWRRRWGGAYLILCALACAYLAVVISMPTLGLQRFGRGTDWPQAVLLAIAFALPSLAVGAWLLLTDRTPLRPTRRSATVAAVLVLLFAAGVYWAGRREVHAAVVHTRRPVDRGPMQIIYAVSTLPALDASGRRVHDVQLFGPEVTDEHVRYLARLPQLQTLRLQGTSVTDQGLRQLRQLPVLRHVSFRTSDGRQPALPPGLPGGPPGAAD